MSEIGLKPCAHCGSKEVEAKQGRMHPFDDSWFVECMKYGCFMHTAFCNQRETAIDIWNKRVIEPELDEVPEKPIWQESVIKQFEDQIRHLGNSVDDLVKRHNENVNSIIELEDKIRILNKYISDCDVGRFEADQQLNDRINLIQESLSQYISKNNNGFNIEDIRKITFDVTPSK